MWRGTRVDTHHYSKAPGSLMNIAHSPSSCLPLTDGLPACQGAGLSCFPSLICSGGSPSIKSDRLSTSAQTQGNLQKKYKTTFKLPRETLLFEIKEVVQIIVECLFSLLAVLSSVAVCMFVRVNYWEENNLFVNQLRLLQDILPSLHGTYYIQNDWCLHLVS